MIKTIIDKSDYQFNPVLESNVPSYDTKLTLFGKDYLIMDDRWMKHVHIKITDKCNAKCPFCIEQHSHVEDNKDNMLKNLRELLDEMNSQNHLTTVSITGGEPSLCPHLNDVIDIVSEYKHGDNLFFTINTNGYNLDFNTKAFDWIDISKHVVGPDGYTKITDLDLNKLLKVKNDTKIRFQSVLWEHGMTSVQGILHFIDAYQDYVDDFSFRRLITTTKNSNSNDLFYQLKQYLYNNAEFVEQVLKDYYVYETWKLNGTSITLSHSNMEFLYEIEAEEPDNLLRELIIHPDGVISGSWDRKRKIIKTLLYEMGS